MKNKFLLVALALACTSAFAGTARVDPATGVEVADDAAASTVGMQVSQLAQLVQINNNLIHLLSNERASAATLDTNHFCYSESKAFSEGAEYKGQTCVRDSGASVVISGQPPKVEPLHWANSEYQSPSSKTH